MTLSEDLKQDAESYREGSELREETMFQSVRARNMEEIVGAVAHIGVDFGHGEFKLNQEHIDKARKILKGGE